MHLCTNFVHLLVMSMRNERRQRSVNGWRRENRLQEPSELARQRIEGGLDVNVG